MQPVNLMYFGNPWQLILVLLVVVLLFGRKGMVSDIMGDFAKGIKSFKKGLAEDDEHAQPPAQSTAPKALDQDAARLDAKPQVNTETKV
jgi:sec-independent protein translocase protein TatA